jgi:hypothetical protein
MFPIFMLTSIFRRYMVYWEIIWNGFHLWLVVCWIVDLSLIGLRYYINYCSSCTTDHLVYLINTHLKFISVNKKHGYFKELWICTILRVILFILKKKKSK